MAVTSESVTRSVAVAADEQQSSGFAEGIVGVSSRSNPAHVNGRVASLDFVKGTLVLLMVLYHWLNYYVGLQWGGYRYLRFLTPSFIFITGFLVSHVYLERYSYKDPRLHFRLARRGLKLLLLFIGLNVIAEQTVGGRFVLSGSDPAGLLAAADAILVKGTGRAAFDILVPIAYFLLLTPVVLVISSRLRIPLFALAAVAIMVTTLAEMGWDNPHLEMLSIALVGLAVGARRYARIVGALRAPVVLVPVYLIYLATIARWNTPFPLQAIGVCLSLLLIDACAIACGAEGMIQRAVVRMGQYSLLAYIAQIIALQLLRRTLSGVPMAGLAAVIPLLLTLAMTLVAVELVAALRERSAVVDRVYRLVFA